MIGINPFGRISSPCSSAVWTKKSVSRLTFDSEKVKSSIAEYNAFSLGVVGGEEGSGRRDKRRDAYCLSVLALRVESGEKMYSL